MSTRPYVNPHTTAAHHSWVDNGNCPAIHTTKAWCAETAGHKGDHRAPYTDGNGKVTAWLYWNDADNHPAPNDPEINRG